MRPQSSNPAAISVIVLAGGQSRRMGQDKAMLCLEGETLLARTVRVLQDISDDVLVAGGDRPAPPGTRSVPDALTGTGPIAGLLAGLRAARYPAAVVVACDHPFLRPEVLRYLADLAPGYQAVVPRLGGLPQPTHAVYIRDSIPVIERQIERGEYGLQRLLGRLQVRWVEEAESRTIDPRLRSFVQVNTPEEWEAVRATLLLDI